MAAQQIVRVPQPPNFIARPKAPVGRYGRGRLFVVTIFGDAKIVTSCRATPDGVVFEVGKIYITI